MLLADINPNISHCQCHCIHNMIALDDSVQKRRRPADRSSVFNHWYQYRARLTTSNAVSPVASMDKVLRCLPPISSLTCSWTNSQADLRDPAVDSKRFRRDFKAYHFFWTLQSVSVLQMFIDRCWLSDIFTESVVVRVACLRTVNYAMWATLADRVQSVSCDATATTQAASEMAAIQSAQTTPSVGWSASRPIQLVISQFLPPSVRPSFVVVCQAGPATEEGVAPARGLWVARLLRHEIAAWWVVGPGRATIPARVFRLFTGDGRPRPAGRAGS